MRLLLLSLFFCTLGHASEWKLVGDKLKKGDREVRIWMAIYKDSEINLKVIDQGKSPRQRTYESLKVAMEDCGALAGTNGGFFQKDFRPMGLTIADGVRIGKFSSAKLLSGVLYSINGKMKIVRRQAFRDNKNITQLLQAGPFLVENGKTVQGLHGGKARARTFVCTDNAGTWALCVIRSLNLKELGEILAQPGLFPKLKIQTALNLDGGSSSGFWQKGVTYSTEWTRVRNFVAFVPKP